MDSATVFERICSVAHSAIEKSNCRMELAYPLALLSPSSTRLSNVCTTTGKAALKADTRSQPCLPIVSQTGLATWSAVPSQPLQPRLQTNTLER